MSIVKVIGEKFKLASRWARVGAFLLDIGLLGFCQTLVILSGFVIYPFLEEFLDLYEPNAGFLTRSIIILLSAALWIFGILLMDGVGKGSGFGKRLMSLQIIHLKDGKPANIRMHLCDALRVYFNRLIGCSLQVKKDSEWEINLLKLLL